MGLAMNDRSTAMSVVCESSLASDFRPSRVWVLGSAVNGQSLRVPVVVERAVASVRLGRICLRRTEAEPETFRRKQQGPRLFAGALAIQSLEQGTSSPSEASEELRWRLPSPVRR